MPNVGNNGVSDTGLPPITAQPPTPPFKGKPPLQTPDGGPKEPPDGGFPSAPPIWGCFIVYWVILIGAIAVLVLLPLMILFPAGIVPLGVAWLAALLAVLAGIALSFLFCNAIACSIMRILTWAMMWSSLITVALAVFSLNGLVLLIGVLYGALAGLLTRWLWDNGCKPYPQLFKKP